MKTKILFLFFALTLLSCKTNKATNDKTSLQGKNNLAAKLIVCSGLTEKKIPLNDLKEINIKEGEKIFFYVKWFNVTLKNHVASMDIVDSNNNYLAQSSEYKFRPKQRSHISTNSRVFYKTIIPEGPIKIRIYLDQKIIVQRQMNLKYIE